ncbi:MAG: PEP-CTERM sorting domain-containing protein [Chthonomonas sp.]|nr:PEP-CTERM sorting domain-containing protein [Chthonomonas sp.]
MKVIVQLVALTFVVQSAATTRDFRFYLSYGDQQLVDLARSAGADPHAVIGSEIPANSGLRVPSMSQFKVRLGVQHIDNGFGPAYAQTLYNFIAYDQASLTNVSYTTAPPLDQFSFRKISPVFTGAGQLFQNLSNYRQAIVYDLNRNTVDGNSDGVPDVATYRSTSGNGVGAYISGNDDPRQVRPVGASYAIRPYYVLPSGISGNGWFKIQPGERIDICDISYNNSLQVNESYGSQPGETGLLLHTTNASQTGYGNNLGYRRTSGVDLEEWHNFGAKYTLIGAAPVPEPGGMVGLLAGLGMLIRRRR